MKGEKFVCGVLPDILRFPNEDSDWDFKVDEEYEDDGGYIHKLLCAKSKSKEVSVRVNEGGIYIMLPLEKRKEFEQILKKFEELSIEKGVDEVGKTFDIDIVVDYETCEYGCYKYSLRDIQIVEKLLEMIYNAI